MIKKILSLVIVLFAINSFAQNSVKEIETKSGIHYITTTVDFPITGTYLFQAAEPIVELNTNGTGIYQLHDLPKRAMTWGLECSKEGTLKFIKGYDSAAYTLWYQFTDSTTTNSKEEWVSVEFSIHFKTYKMYIQGERVKEYNETVEK